jgi:integrase
MATITERPTQDGAKSYRVEIRMKGAPRVSGTFTRLTDARRWASATETAIREGRYFRTVEAKRHTLGDAIDRYARDVLPTKKTSTAQDQARQLAWWKRRLGDRVLFDITPELLAEYRDILSKEPITPRQPPRKPGTPIKESPARYRAPGTVTRYLAVLSHLLTTATNEWRWIDSNPMSKITKPKEPRGRVRYLSEDATGPHGETIPGELTRLMKACRESESPDLYAAVVLALSTGARAQEILGLRWPQVDFTRRVATLLDTKNDEIRTLPLTGLALALLRERSKVRRLDTDLVFPGRKIRAPGADSAKAPAYRPVVLRTPFLTALKRAGITDFRWHDLRHSAASYLAMGGASLAEIAEILGHKTLEMVRRYAHLSPAHTAAVVERMNKRIFGGGG